MDKHKFHARTYRPHEVLGARVPSEKMSGGSESLRHSLDVWQFKLILSTCLADFLALVILGGKMKKT